MSPPAIAVAGRVAFADGQTLEVPALEIPAGRWTCLLGPSGAGKSTLLRLLAGLSLGGAFTGEVATSDRAPLPGRVAYMAQDDLLCPWLDLRGNLALGPRLRGEAVDRARVDALLDQTGLAGQAEKRPTELSGGMRQRAALARALLEDRPVALLDEPFSALDARTRAEMQELAHATLAGRTVLIVTHDPAEAARLADRLYLVTDTVSPEPPPKGPAIRPADGAETLRAQAGLLRRLRAA